LVLCDIDETILAYNDINPLWWKEKNEYYMNIFGDHDLAKSYSLDDWFNYIQNNKPSYTAQRNPNISPRQTFYICVSVYKMSAWEKCSDF
jgi:hypothetical protein